MPKINLLPWRESLREQNKRKYLYALVLCAGTGLASVVTAHVYYSNLIEQQQGRNNFLKKEIQTLDRKIEQIKSLDSDRTNLLARMKAIDELQTSRPVIVHLFDELVSTVPEGVRLSEITQKNAKLTIKGVAQSNARVSNYMRNVESSRWVNDPELSIIQSRDNEGERIAEFVLTFSQSKPKFETEKL